VKERRTIFDEANITDEPSFTRSSTQKSESSRGYPPTPRGRASTATQENVRAGRRRAAPTPHSHPSDRERGPIDGVPKLAPKLGLPVYPRMRGDSTGFKLANDGHDTRSIQHYLGHKNTQHTVSYTDLAPTRFKDFWKD